MGHFIDTVNVHDLLICFYEDMYGKTGGSGHNIVVLLILLLYG